MPEFRVTREHTQELVETGSIQLPMSTLPQAHELAELLYPIDHKDTSVTFSYADFDDLGIFTDLKGVAGQLLVGCYGIQSTWKSIRQQTFRARVGKSLLPHRDAGGKLKGISIICTGGLDPTEKLNTHGRGIIAGDTKSYLYKNGPVVITQDRFGSPLINADVASGATWHIPERECEARVGVLDFIL